MSQITAADVKKLRELTGAGMMDCKKALTEAGGDFDAAVDLLRKKGLAAASKKAGRIAAEGMVLAKSAGQAGVIVEVNAETDFVSKNEKFTSFVNALADLILKRKPDNLEALKALDFDGENTVEEALAQLIATIGENMTLRRFRCIEVEHGTVAAYVHGAGKIGVLVGISGDVDENLARGVAMHVAAANPRYIKRDDVPEKVIEREKAVLSERAQASGKPAAIIDKIVQGQLNKFFSEICLLEQPFVMDTDVSVGKALGDAQVVAMERYALGEGIEKKEEDFAAEVAAQIKG
ncbi:MAG: elongation factor Ts [Zetaproteobacteria bacterium]|nr:MAG: elongation factor Ts [Zetaproteobacteria bacterium]